MSKYDPLHRRLRREDGEQLRLSFEELDQLVDRLPPTARSTRSWWANNRDRHVQAAAWLDAGWKVDIVDLDHQHVTYRRGQP
jgi:hypothetical protein